MAIFTDPNGTKWYLHKKRVYFPKNKIWVDGFYFSRKIGENYYEGEIPPKYIVVMSKRLPILKKRHNV